MAMSSLTHILDFSVRFFQPVYFIIEKIEKASEMQQPSCKSKSFGLVL
jgi:hypothetical protein